MLRLNLNARPAWLDLFPGVRVKVRPITSALITEAVRDADMQNLPADIDPDLRMVHFAKAMARVAILEWEGVADADGQALAPSADAIGALMDLHQINMAFRAAYVARGFLLAEEKKDFASLPNGTSAGAPDTAPAATEPVPNVRPN